MNGKVCCLLGLCCPPGSADQLNAFTAEFVKAGLSETDARIAAKLVLDNFDLAPSGTLGSLKAEIAKIIKAQKSVD